MINSAVINLKEFVGQILKIVSIIILVIIFFRILANVCEENYINNENLKKSVFFESSKIINESILITKYYDKENSCF